MSAADFTTDDLAAIRRAITRGERSVQYADRSVTYRSMDELIAAEARIAAALGVSNARPKQTRAVGSKGFC